MTKTHLTSRTRSRQTGGLINFRALLSGGDRRSIGKSNQVVALLENLIAMRAADALEKASRVKGTLLQRFKAQLLGLLGECIQQEVRWHLAVMVPRLGLTAAECRRAAELLESYLEDRSSIVKTSAMQGLFDLTRQDESLRPDVTELIRSLTRSGTAAMRARGRQLLKLLES